MPILPAPLPAIAPPLYENDVIAPVYPPTEGLATESGVSDSYVKDPDNMSPTVASPSNEAWTCVICAVKLNVMGAADAGTANDTNAAITAGADFLYRPDHYFPHTIFLFRLYLHQNAYEQNRLNYTSLSSQDIFHEIDGKNLETIGTFFWPFEKHGIFAMARASSFDTRPNARI